MPRRNVPHRHPAAAGTPAERPVRSGSLRREDWRGESYDVRSVAGSGANTYRCPGCDQVVGATPHLVTWPSDDLEAEDRRHWHSACWAARDRRSPTRRWS